MPESTCTFPGCDRPHKCKGLCSGHYKQKWQGRELEPIHSIKADEPRFWSKVEKSNDCWTWTGCVDTGGYGVAVFGGKRIKAHRVAVTLAGTEIPDGVDVDHVCHNRACVNPDHLRVATRKQNVENLSGAHRDNRTGVRGVSWNERNQKYMARVTHNYRQIYLGLFDTIEEANAAVTAKRLEIYTHNNLDRTAA